MTTNRTRRDRKTWTVVRLPERALSEVILHLVAPVLDPNGPAASPDDSRRVLDLAIRTWNAHVHASLFWGNPRPKPLAELRRAMRGKQGLADTFELLSARWRAEFRFDPRLVGEWSFEVTASGRPHLVCATILPEGVKEEVLPPVEKRIAIGGRFLDEVYIRQSATSGLSFPVEHHRGETGADGTATVYAKMPSVVALFAEGVLKPVGGAPVDVMVGGKKLGPMVLREIRCSHEGGHNDVAVLVFHPGDTGATC